MEKSKIGKSLNKNVTWKYSDLTGYRMEKSIWGQKEIMVKVIATAANGPHLKALAEHLSVQMKHEDNVPGCRVGGSPESNWVVIDLIDVVVHIFNAEMREHYALESLWNDAPVERLVDSNNQSTSA